MTVTTYRQGCGTHMGLLLHKAAGESPCGECAQGELLRRVEVEQWPVRVRHPAALPISRRQAEANLAALMEAMSDAPRPALLSPGPPDRRPKITTSTPKETASG